jgi:predicted HD superfamily hydrolase involved in NAD metabolism
MKPDLISIRQSMKKNLDPKRYEHTLGVAFVSTALAMCHGADIRKAQLAGLLHDCAKCVDDQKKIAICEKHNIEISETERRNPFLLHAKAGSYIAMEKYDVSDEEVLQAILNHITGRPAMSLLEKIVYIADYIEPSRQQAPRLAIIRQEAFRDLDKALLMVLEDILDYLHSLDSEIDIMTQRTYEFYKNQG